MKKLLVVVDMQNDFVTGALGSAEAKKAVAEAKPFIEREIAAGAELAFTLDTHGADYANTQEGKLLPVPHCIKGTAGWEVVPELSDYARNSVLFEKGAFASSELAEFAKAGGFGEITLCGVCTDICVISNALLLKAFCPETVIKIIARACAGTTAQNHASALAVMKSCQVTVDE